MNIEGLLARRTLASVEQQYGRGRLMAVSVNEIVSHEAAGKEDSANRKHDPR